MLETLFMWTQSLPSTLGCSCLICSHRKKSCSTFFHMYVFYCCIIDCHNISSLIVFMGQEFRPTLSWFFRHGQLSCIHIWRWDWGRIHFQAHFGCYRIHFIADVCLSSVLSCFSQGPFLAFRDYPQFPDTWTLLQITDHPFKAC